MFGGALDSNAKEDLKNLPRGTVGEGEGEGQKKSSFLVNSKWQVCSQLPNFNPGPSDDLENNPGDLENNPRKLENNAESKDIRMPFNFLQKVRN